MTLRNWFKKYKIMNLVYNAGNLICGLKSVDKICISAFSHVRYLTAFIFVWFE